MTYGGTYRYYTKIQARYGVEHTFVDTANPESVRSAFRPNTKLLHLESPTNPTMRLCDIALLSKMAHERGIIVVVDNTFASPYLQRPLALGADIVYHSTTKFLNGHSDSIGGIAVAKSPEHVEWLSFVQNSSGAILSPMGGRHSIPLGGRCQAGISPGVDRVLQPHGAVRILLRGNEPQRNGPAGGLDERDSFADQDGLDVHDNPVHLARVEEGSEERRSADEPDVLPLFLAEPPRELLDRLLDRKSVV